MVDCGVQGDTVLFLRTNDDYRVTDPDEAEIQVGCIKVQDTAVKVVSENKGFFG